MLYALNLYNDASPLFLNKTGKIALLICFQVTLIWLSQKPYVEDHCPKGFYRTVYGRRIGVESEQDFPK